jgi:hypothetical protein
MSARPKSLVPPIPAAVPARSKVMNEKNEKKLRLNKETIRNLSDESLEQVAGGKKKGDTGLICVSLVKLSACVGCSIIC